MADRLPKLKTLGERIAWAREKANMTQDDLSKALGMDQTAVSKWELEGVKNPRKIEQLSKILGVPVSWLRFGEESLEKLKPENVEALFELQDLSAKDQQTVRDLIKSLSAK